MRYQKLKVALATALTLIPPSAAFAGGRGGGGGGRGGGGGGFHGGGGGGGFRGGGGFAGGGGGFRGGAVSAPHYSAPHYNMPSAGASHFNAPRYGGNTAAAAPYHSPSFSAPRSFNGAGGNTFNPGRANYGNVGNRTNINNRTINNNTNIIRSNNFAGNNFNRGVGNNFNRGNMAYAGRVPANFSRVNGGLGWTGRNGYYGYHSGWNHGFWNYGYPRYWGGYGGYGGYGFGNGFGWGLGLGVGTGLLAFGLGSGLYNWGYGGGYYNPYYYSQPATIVVQQGFGDGQPLYDYNQPIDTMAPPPDSSIATAAVSSFDEARAAFMAGDYATAMGKTNESLVKMPNDPTIHEFRALVFFAQGKYDEAATALYPVLSAGPGWDWTTMVGLYPGVDVYTQQLKALQNDSAARPDAAQDHFLLAYHYLTQGYPKNAEYELSQVVKLQPKDTLSARLLDQLRQTQVAPPAGAGGAAGALPAGADPTALNVPNDPGALPPADAAPPASKVAMSSLVGEWAASPNPDTSISLSLKEDNTFTWNVKMKSGPKTLSGNVTLGSDVLTLVPSSGDPLVGRVSLTDANSFSFKALGGPSNDPGLTFTKK